ncbi:MAG: helix-turn-helix transcriptional regulator, partial [Opitutales bacterium]
MRRKLSATQVAERAGISRRTLVSIESGEPTVAMGNYFQVLRVLGLERDFQLLARDDEMGRKLQDLELTPKRRALNESPHHEPSVCDKVFFDEAAARSNAFEY